MRTADLKWLEQMASILETLNEGVLIVDENQTMVFVNGVLAQLVGAQRSELQGKTSRAFYAPEDYEYIQARVFEAKLTGRVTYEFFLPRMDGTRLPVIISGRIVEDPGGRPFSVITFADISKQKEAEQSLRQANVRLQQRAEEIDRELQLAERVQQSLAPRALAWESAAIETYYRPAYTIGGDFGLVMPRPSSHLDLIVCDVSGHGISSALMANRIYTETLSQLGLGTPPQELLQRINRFVVKHIGTSGFMFTMAAARLDHHARQLTYAAAGHPPGFLISPSGNLRQLETRGTVLGAFEDAIPDEPAQSIPLSAGDRLLLYSDGLTEVWNSAGEMLGVGGLEEIVRKGASLPLSGMRDAIMDAITSYSGQPIQDDVTLILAEVR